MYCTTESQRLREIWKTNDLTFSADCPCLLWVSAVKDFVGLRQASRCVYINMSSCSYYEYAPVSLWPRDLDRGHPCIAHGGTTFASSGRLEGNAYSFRCKFSPDGMAGARFVQAISFAAGAVVGGGDLDSTAHALA